MRLTCPNCGAEYDVPEGLIPPAGKHVQCTACHTRWFMRGQAREELSEDQILRKLETRGPGPKAGASAAAPIPFPVSGTVQQDTVKQDTAKQDAASRDAREADVRPAKAPPDDAPFNWQSPVGTPRDVAAMSTPGTDRAAPEVASDGDPSDTPAGTRRGPALRKDTGAGGGGAGGTAAADRAGPSAKAALEPAAERRAEPRPSIPAPRRDPAQDQDASRDSDRGSGQHADRDAASEHDLAASRIALREAPRSAPPRLDLADGRADGRPGTTPPSRAKRRFLPGFILALLIAGLALEIYIWRDPLADQIPAAAPVIDGYANAIDAAREWLRDRFGGAQDNQPG